MVHLGGRCGRADTVVQGPRLPSAGVPAIVRIALLQGTLRRQWALERYCRLSFFSPVFASWVEKVDGHCADDALRPANKGGTVRTCTNCNLRLHCSQDYIIRRQGETRVIMQSTRVSKAL